MIIVAFVILLILLVIFFPTNPSLFSSDLEDWIGSMIAAGIMLGALWIIAYWLSKDEK